MIASGSMLRARMLSAPVILVAMLAAVAISEGSIFRTASADHDDAELLTRGDLKAIRRDLIEEGSLGVCIRDYPVAAAEAMRLWNNAVGRNIFRSLGDCSKDTKWNSADVSIKQAPDDQLECNDDVKDAAGCAWPQYPDTPGTSYANLTGTKILLNRITYPQDGTGNAPLLYVLIHELGHALGIGHAELCGDENLSVIESGLGGICSPDQPELQPYDIENYRKAYRPGATGKPRVSRDGNRHLLTWDAGNVHTAHGFEIQQRLHGTAQWATVRWVAMNTSEPTQEGRSQRLYPGAVYEYRIVTTTRALPGTPHALGDASAIAIEPGPTGDPPDRGDSSRDPPWPPAGPGDAAPHSPPVATAPPPTAQCTLRTDASPQAGGSASATLADGAATSVLSGDCGAEASVTAAPAAGYRFTGWSGDAGGTANPLGVTLDGSKSVTAHFARCALTATAGTGGSVSGGGTFDCGTARSVTATPDTGYRFSGWSGGASGTANPLSVTLNGDVSVRASFEALTYTLTTSVSPPGGGSVQVVPAGPYRHGAKAYPAGFPASCYRFTGWSGAVSGYRVLPPITMDADKSVTAHFGLRRHTLTVTAGPGGSASGGGTFDCGTARTVTATPDRWFRFSGWSGDASGTNLSAAVRVTREMTARASFTRRQCTLGVTSGAGGSASGGGTFGCGTSRTATATPDRWFRFSGWSGDASGTNLSAAVALTGNKRVHASFTRRQCTLGVTSGAGGSASGGGTFGCGTSRTATATPDRWFRFSGWSGDASGTNLSAAVALTGNKRAHASFTRRQCTLTVRAGAGGTVSAGGTFGCGTIVRISATPNAGYYFHRWYGSGIGNVTSASTTVSMTGNKTVTAAFRWYRGLSLSVSPSGTGYVSGGGSYRYGATASIRATAKADHYFKHWKEGSTIVSTSSRTTIAMYRNRSLTAVFDHICNTDFPCGHAQEAPP